MISGVHLSYRDCHTRLITWPGPYTNKRARPSTVSLSVVEVVGCCSGKPVKLVKPVVGNSSWLQDTEKGGDGKRNRASTEPRYTLARLGTLGYLPETEKKNAVFEVTS